MKTKRFFLVLFFILAYAVSGIAAKPADLPEWDTTEVNVVEPSQANKDEGWLAPGGIPEKPSFEYFNYWQNLVYKWIAWIVQIVDPLESTAELRAISYTPDDGDVVTVTGYYTPGDGGGGQFYWDAASVLADNGGTIIKVTSITTGRWLRIYNSEIYVDWFGANTTPGTTDMTTPINSAFDAAPVGTTVKFYGETYIYSPVAQYDIEKSINITMAPGGLLDVRGAADDLWLIHMKGTTENSLPLGADATENDKTIVVSATLAATLSPGDLIYIDSTDLWSTSYRKGEFCEVLSISGTTVTLVHRLNDSYLAATTEAMKVLSVTGTVTGLNVLSLNTKAHIAIAFSYCRDVEVVGGSTLGAEYTGLFTNFCYHTAINDFTTNDANGASIGTNYGISVTSSQYTVVNGCIANGGRHGLNTGGNRPVRYTTIINNVISSEGENEYGLNFHLNAQYAEVKNNTITDKAKIQGYDFNIIGNNFTDTAGTNASIFYNAEEGRECRYINIKDNTFKQPVQNSINIIVPKSGIGALSVSNNEPIGPVLISTVQDLAAVVPVNIDSLKFNNNNMLSTNGFIGLHIVGDSTNPDINISNCWVENNNSSIDNIFALLSYTDMTNLYFRGNMHKPTGAGSDDYHVYNTNSTIENAYINSNHSISSTSSIAYRVTTTDYISCTDNHVDGYTTTAVRLASANILFADNQHPTRFLSMVLTGKYYDRVFGRGNRSTWGSGPPTTNSWEKSDICWNSGAVAGGIPGWVCTTSGTPGTWKAMAALAP